MSETVISSVFICPKCKYTNPSKSKFCMQCGNPLSDAAKQTKKPKLLLLNNSNVESEFVIDAKSVLGKGGDISVKGADFAGNICEFKVEGDRLILQAFTEDVFLQANKNKPLELAHGTILKIGDKIFKVDIQ